jgi:hypothetical protein
MQWMQLRAADTNISCTCSTAAFTADKVDLRACISLTELIYDASRFLMLNPTPTGSEGDQPEG